MTALQQCTEMDKHLSASTTRRSELKLQFGSRDPLPISGKDPLQYHYFAFVDPSGTVVYPKGYHQALFAECAWEGKTMIQHFSSGGTDERWAEANRVNTLVYIGPYGGWPVDDSGASVDPRVLQKDQLMEQLATSGTGVSYNFETGIVTDKYGDKYRNGTRVE